MDLPVVTLLLTFTYVSHQRQIVGEIAAQKMLRLVHLQND